MRKKTKPRSRRDKDADLITIDKLDRQGYTQLEIGKMLGLTQQAISNDLKLLRTKRQEYMHKAHEEYVREKLAEYSIARKELWEAWNNSKSHTVKRRGKKSANQKAGTEPDIELITVPTKPDPNFVKLVLEIHQAERELLGLDKPRQLDIRQATLNWDAIVQFPQNRNEDLEARINQVLVQPHQPLDKLSYIPNTNGHTNHTNTENDE